MGIREVNALQNAISFLGTSDTIWIASTPQNQLATLQTIEHFQGRLILEKPAGCDLVDYENLIAWIQSATCRVYLSQPWTYSRIWIRAKELITEMVVPIEISTKRVGEIRRDYLHPPQDWMPHDLLLLHDLLVTQNESISQLQVDWSEGFDAISIKGSLVNKSTFIMLAGFSPGTKEAIWMIIDSAKNRLIVDFDRKRLETFNTAGQIVIEEFPVDNPVVNMFLAISSDELPINLNGQLELQRLLIL